MKAARGTPWRFIALNGTGAFALLAFTLAMVFGSSLERPHLLLDIVLPLLTLLAFVWLDLLLLFFRDPERRVGEGCVAPADGRVEAASVSGGVARVSIFLGVFNVHVVRAPLSGRVTRLEHRPGGRRLAFSKESAHNQRVVVELAGEGGPAVLTLIAGAFADRILPYVAVGDLLSKGERLGIIKFGSRVDLEVPALPPLALLVKPGDTVKAGETAILAPPREAASP
ncbi:MAG TPA: phosphatidylserine decarboxylase [Candidatus Thermoplasmatota archaeon]|nr:phosphatidylserine decarboxylase [Candidatus Thermoplasmatota archaeon]